MIPKIIHYCWLSNDPFPPQIQKCIDSWKKVLPDYELMLWNYDRFPRGKSKWVDQAFDAHMYAFAADYIRLYALYNYGGIYLDSDVEVIKSFNDLLDLPYFICQEDHQLGIEAATIGCEKVWCLIEDMYMRYQNREFVNKDSSYNKQPLPVIFMKCLEAKYDFHVIRSKKDFQRESEVINIFASDFFSPKNYLTKELKVTGNTYSIHHFTSSWVTKDFSSSNTSMICQSLMLKIEQLICILLANSFCKLHPVTIISNNSFLTRTFYYYFHSKPHSPFVQGSMNIIDLLELKTSLDTIDDLKLNFIKIAESKYPVNDFYPIARLGNSNIEIEFSDDALPIRHAIQRKWNQILEWSDVDNAIFIFVIDNKTLSEQDAMRIRKIAQSSILITPVDMGFDYQMIVGDLQIMPGNKIKWNKKGIMRQLFRLILKIRHEQKRYSS